MTTRLGRATVALLAVSPGFLRGWTRRDLAGAAVFGSATALMNLFFYLAIDRIDLGKGVALMATHRPPLESYAAILGGAFVAAPAMAQGAPTVSGNVAIVSVPGEYAALEAHQALSSGLHVLLFQTLLFVLQLGELLAQGDQFLAHADIALLVFGEFE